RTDKEVRNRVHADRGLGKPGIDMTIDSIEELRRIFDEVRTAHGLGNERKIARRNLELTKPERRTPVCLALDERKTLDERLDRHLVAVREPNIDPVRLEVGRH